MRYEKFQICWTSGKKQNLEDCALSYRVNNYGNLTIKMKDNQTWYVPAHAYVALDVIKLGDNDEEENENS